MSSAEMLVLGRIVAPHGVRGELRIKPETDRPEIFADLPHFYIDGNRYRILSVRPHKNVYCVVFAGVESREDAQALVGKWIEMPKEELPPRPEGTYYISDLIGLQVVDVEGNELGILSEVLQPGANDVYVISSEKGVKMLPALKKHIPQIDLQSGKMVVDMPEWVDEDAH